MKELVQLLLLLVIALATLVLFGPIVVMLTIIGKVELVHFKIDLSHLGRISRIILGVLGLGFWLAVYVPLVWLLMTFQPPSTLGVAAKTPLPLAEITVDPMDSIAGWGTYHDDRGSAISMRVASGIRGDAVEIGYDLKPDGWVGIFKQIDPSVLMGTTRIRFYYSGYGMPNTIELKLIYKGGAVFSTQWPGVTNGEWRVLEAPYDQFACWEATGCVKGERVDLSRVDRIDFAISNKAGNTPGIGVVRIDSVEAIK